MGGGITMLAEHVRCCKLLQRVLTNKGVASGVDKVSRGRAGLLKMQKPRLTSGAARVSREGESRRQ